MAEVTLSREQLLAQMYSSGGWKIFEEDLQTLKDNLEYKISEMLYVHDDRLDMLKLNNLSARVKEINRILLTAEASKEEATSPNLA